MPDAADARRIAVLIGQNRFPKAEHLTDLAFAEADMNALAEQLTSAPGVPYDKVITIPTGPSYRALEQMEDVAAHLGQDDTLFIYYSGHGLLDKARRLNLAFENTVETRLTSTALKVGQILDLFRSGRAKSRVLVLDCCYAGGVGAEFDRSSIPQQIENDIHGTGTVVLTSATKAQVARENPDYGHGIFTKHMLDGLAGAADANGDGIITTQELYEYTHRMVTAECGQRPQRFNHELEGRIVLHHTGLTPWKDKADAIAATLKTLNADHALSDRMFLETFALAKKQPAQMTAQERKRFTLLETIDPDTFRSGAFENEWNALKPLAKPDAPPREQQPSNPPPPQDDDPYVRQPVATMLSTDGDPIALSQSALDAHTKRQRDPDAAAGSKDVLGLLQSGQQDDLKKHMHQYWASDAAPAPPQSEPPQSKSLWQRYWNFVRPGSKASPPEWVATATFVGFVLVTLMVIGNADYLFKSPEELGFVMILAAVLGVWQTFTRHIGTARWRKFAYWMYSGLLCLAGLGFLTNVGY